MKVVSLSAVRTGCLYPLILISVVTGCVMSQKNAILFSLVLTFVTEDRDKWLAFVNTVMKCWIP